MEQNEGVLIRVYQDKERQFTAEMQSMRQKLASSQQTENTLRNQLQHSNEIRQQLQKSIQLLTEDRNIQQRKCLQLENELNSMKIENEMNNFGNVIPQQQQNCQLINNNNGVVSASIYENTMNNNNLNELEIIEKVPIPAPRIHKVFN